LVVERGRDARACFWIVLGAEIAPHRRTLGLPVALKQRLIQERARDLVAATGGEDRLDERGGRDDVRLLERKQRDLQQRVLGRQLRSVDAYDGIVDVLVDAGDPCVAVVRDLLSLSRLRTADGDRRGIAGE